MLEDQKERIDLSVNREIKFHTNENDFGVLHPITELSVPSSLLMADSGILSRTDNIFVDDKTRRIEKLEEELVSEKRSTQSANEQCEIERKEKCIIQKKYAKLEKENKKLTRERDFLKYDLKISEDVKRNLLFRLDNS